MIKALLLLLLVLCVTSLGLAYLLAPKYALSIATGIGVVFLVNTYFILRVFRYSGDKRSSKVATSFMYGSMGKLSIASGLFGLLFVGFFNKSAYQQTDQAFALMLGFFCVYLAYIVLVALWVVLK